MPSAQHWCHDSFVLTAGSGGKAAVTADDATLEYTTLAQPARTEVEVRFLHALFGGVISKPCQMCEEWQGFPDAGSVLLAAL